LSVFELAVRREAAVVSVRSCFDELSEGYGTTSKYDISLFSEYLRMAFAWAYVCIQTHIGNPKNI
jgi:hypothetical protein